MLKRLLSAGAVALVVGCATPSTDPGGRIAKRAATADHPSDLSFEPAPITIPDASDYRYEMSNGNVAYIVPDPSLPLVEITFYSPVGSYIVESEQAGIAGLTSAMLRQGGTAELSADDLDERLDFLATDIGFSIGSTSSAASIDTLTANLDESLGLLFDMLTEPRFDADRLSVTRNRLIENMRRRNDDTRSIEPRYWSEILYGSDFFLNGMSTQASVETVDGEAMRALTKKIFGTGNLVIAASGAVDPAELIAKLEAQLSRLPEATTDYAIPSDVAPAAPGVYGIDKDDVNQTRVSIGHPGLRLGHPDDHAIRIMNFILGGGGFVSRITQRVRSDEGLAYSAGSQFSLGVYYPGQFRAYLQSKNASVPEAIGIVLEEVDRIRSTSVTEAELKTAKQGTVASLEDIFDSSSGRASRFAQDHLIGRSNEYWKSFEANVEAVSIEDIQRVANTHLKPDQLRILLVGKLDEAQAGDGEHGTLESITGRELQQLRLRDPLTGEVLP